MIPAPRQPTRRWAVTLTLVAAILVFWRTAFPTITWWDSSSYSLAAATLGVASPPGSLLLTLVGWPIAHLPFIASPARALNLLAGAFAAITVAFVAVVGATMAPAGGREPGTRSDWAVLAGAGLGALAFAFSGTLWSYAGRFTPYVLSPLFTTLIVWTLLRWWNAAERTTAWRWVALLGLLVGLDFSVHRTNALLVPGALAWIAIRRPRALRELPTVCAGVVGLAAGLAVHLLLIPIARLTHSPLDFNSPSTFSAFWDYVTIKQLGGSFLLQLFPRKSPVWSVQMHDFLRILGDNFLHWSGRAGVLGALPAVAAVVGVVALWSASRRLACAFLLLVLTQAALTVLYFNIPADYFRTFDRHYLPVCATIAMLVATGTAVAARWAATLIRSGNSIAAVVIAGLVLLLPITQLAVNWQTHDASRRFFTKDYATNALRQLPPNAIYFTVGDNDTFPVMYMQAAEGLRPDVTIINLSVANIPDWPERLRNRDPSLPLSLSPAERRRATDEKWKDTTMVLSVPRNRQDLGLSPETPVPATISLAVKPRSGSTMLPAEIVLLDIVRTNGWRRPLTFAITGTRSAMEWLEPYGRLDGLFYRVVPVANAPSDPAVLRAQLLENNAYRGYADPALPLDDVSSRMGSMYYAVLESLLQADVARRDIGACRADRRAVLTALPFERLDPPGELRASIGGAC